MLNKLWSSFILISIIYSFFSGNLESLNNELFKSIDSTITVCIQLLGTICFWNGIMSIATKTSFINIITKIFRPLMKVLFPKLNKESKVYKDISMNITSNLLGLGNAATPLGISAIKELDKQNNKKNELSKEMKLFIVINTASIQIIPTTVIAIRNSLHSQNPTEIIFPIWVASIIAFVTVVGVMKIVTKMEE